MLLAWTEGSGEVVLYALTILALLTGWPMIRQEEAELEHHFGDEYLAYGRAVPAGLLPRLFFGEVEVASRNNIVAKSVGVYLGSNVCQPLVGIRHRTRSR